MPIDASIPLNVQSLKLESPMNQLAMASDVMKIGEMNRGIQEQNKLNEYLQNADLTKPETRQELMKYGKTGLAYGKALAEQEKTGLETKKLGFEIDAKKMDLFRERIGNLEFNPSNANIQAHLEDSVKRGEISPTQAQQQFTQATAVPLDQRPNYFRNMGTKVEERYKMNNISAADKARLSQAESHFQIGQQNAGQALTDAAGNVTVLDKQGNVMKQLGPISKPSATFEKTAALQKQHGKDLDLAITEISKAIEPGGMLEKSTASGAGKLRDAAGNFIGYATEGSINAASLKPIADLGLKMVPRFEGPQSDKDTASYKEAAGQLANENLPVATRKAAAQTVVRLMKARKGQFVNEAMANEGISASAGAPALPPGFTPDK